MSDTDWHSMDDSGVEVEQQIERLRSFIRKRLAAAEYEGRKVSGRLEAVEHARDVSETLALLEFAQAAIDEARSLLDRHFDEDTDLLVRVRTLVAERVDVKALEMVHFITAGSIVRLAPQVDDSLAWFASQRGLPYEAIEVPALPEAAEMVDEARERALAIASEGKRAIGDLAGRVRNRRGNDGGAAELGAGQVAEALPPETGISDPVDPDGLAGRFSKVRSAALSRIRRRADEDAAPTDQPSIPMEDG